MALSELQIVCIIGTVSVLIYKYIFHPVLVSPLASVPNAHWTAPLSSAWITWRRFKATNNRTIHVAHKRLGPIVRVAPNEISINCVDGGIKTVYGGGFEKHEWYPRVFGSLG